MRHPLLYEINTRCWLNDLSARHGARITLANVPQSEFDEWRRLGFTHIWLMGAWSVGLRSREFSRRNPHVKKEGAALLADFRVEDIAGSPYAIEAYRVAEALGGEPGLRVFRENLAASGLKLILDFIPNHTGLDHPRLVQNPESFVQLKKSARGGFAQETATGTRWIAHGRDPYFPPWADTAQIDHRNPAARAAVLAELRSVAGRCDGVRCDMAMLALNDVFARTWAGAPSAFDTPGSEFWPEAIADIRQAHPGFLFLGEVYWDLEQRLQTLGFDYTYNKRIYDHLVARRHGEVQSHLLGHTPEFTARSAHFLENHDEPRIASLLSFEEHRAATLVTLALPGMRLLHEGQLGGAMNKVGVHFSRRPEPAVILQIAAMYERLLTKLRLTAVGRGDCHIIRPLPAWADNPTAQNCVIVQWQATPPEFDLVVVNLAPHRSQCFAPLTVPGLGRHKWEMSDWLGEERHERSGPAMTEQGLYLDLPAHGAQLFHCRPSAKG